MSALFNKKNETTIAELEEYYANQKKGRSATAWFMAFLSLLITVAIIVGLFFAGRWAYRTFIDNDSTDTASSDTQEGSNLPSFDSDPSSNIGVEFEEGSSNNPDDLVVVQGDNTSSQSGTVDSGAAVTTESNVDRLANNSANAVAGDSTTEIPNTGAGETTLAALVAISILGYAVHRRYLLQK